MFSLNALIFDVDGTLAETERDGHRVAFNQAFLAAGLDWQWTVELYGKLLNVAGGKERIRFYLDTYHPHTPNVSNWDDMIAQLHFSKTQYYKQIVASGQLSARPGVKRLIAEARSAGVRLAIATTSAPENAIALFRTILGHDSPNWFEVIAAGDIVPHKKPAPDVYQYVLSQMDLAPDTCMVFEDSEQGLSASTQAGLKTIVTVNSYTRHHSLEPAALVVSDLGEPNHPFIVLSGNVGQANYVDLALIQTILNGSAVPH